MIFKRMLRAAKLEPGLYEEVEADKGATIEATLVVVISSLATGIGLSSTAGGSGLIGGTLGALIGWVVWAFLILLIGTKLLPEAQTKSDMGELLRTLGFAMAPGVIMIFGFIHPTVVALLWLVSSFWILAAVVMAVRQALDYKSTGRAIGVVLIGWLVQSLVRGFFYFLIVGTTAGPVN